MGNLSFWKIHPAVPFFLRGGGGKCFQGGHSPVGDSNQRCIWKLIYNAPLQAFWAIHKFSDLVNPDCLDFRVTLA